MPPFRARGTHFHTASMLVCVALLSACGSNPETTEANTAAVNEAVEEAVNIAEAVENTAIANEAAKPPVEAAATKPAEAAPAAAPSAAAPAATTAGDAANGAKLFAQCKICHAVEPGKNGLGPTLHGVVGRKAGTLAGFSFSNAMKDSGIVWNNASLSDYLRSPMKSVPGTKMAFAGIANDGNRADVIAYLDTLK
jgi:cytochrome c